MKLTPEQIRLRELKRRQTNIQRYGTPYPAQSEIVKNKTKQTNLEKYGTHPSKTEQTKQKIQQTNLERYGYQWVSQSPIIQEKITQTMKNTYGVKRLKQKALSKDILQKLEDVNWLQQQHIECSNTITYIAKLLGVSQSVVSQYFKKHGLIPKSRNVSQFEREIVDFLQPITEVETNSRKIIPPYEIDIFLPLYNIALECNGLFWHGEQQGKDRNYHLTKYNLCKDKNIRLIQIFDYEWNNKNDIVKSRLLHLLGKNERIYARNTTIKQINSIEANDFFEQTHIQGNVQSSISYGLFLDNEIVAAMSFGIPRFSKKYQWELLRFSSKLYTTVIGGAGKLFNYFIKNHQPCSIITYSDKRWNVGDLYLNLGFNFLHTSKPNYYYFLVEDQNQLFHRVQFQKHKLASKLRVFDPSLTEYENMINNGYDRIWDCGNDVFVWTSKH